MCERLSTIAFILPTTYGPHMRAMWAIYAGIRRKCACTKFFDNLLYHDVYQRASACS